MSPESPHPPRFRRTALRRFLHDLRRTVRTRRRPLAAVCAAVAVTAALQVVRPPDPTTSPVLVAEEDLQAGSTVSASDVRIAQRRPEAVPAQAYDEVDDAAGRTVAAPMRAGEALTDLRVVQPGLLDGYPRGSALCPVRVADRAALAGLRVGDEVDVVGVDPEAERDPTVLAQGVPVASLPRETPEHEQGAVVLLVVPQEVALDLADAAVRTRLTVVSVL